MNVKIEFAPVECSVPWDAYVKKHPNGTLYHLSGWRNVIRNTYGHKTYYLMATRNLQETTNSLTTKQKLVAQEKQNSRQDEIVGVLPLVHLKHFFGGNSLISIPFFDMAGVLADNAEIENELICEAIKLGRELSVSHLEIRQTRPMAPEYCNKSSLDFSGALNLKMETPKVRMMLELAQSSEKMLQSFKAKLRSQIKKPIKEGLRVAVGGQELVEDFYSVFVRNMRDLGSPVHSKDLILSVFEEFNDCANIIVVNKEDRPLAVSLIMGFNNVLQNPWASSLREYSNLSPNMLLYWSMLEYACNNGFSFFDFGRSTPGSGTYKFKKQWGANGDTLYWHLLYLKDQSESKDLTNNKKVEMAINCWRKMPIPITKIIGPIIRKYIGL